MTQDTKKIGWFSRLANPSVFLSYANPLIKWLALGALVLIATGLIAGFMAPEDEKQGAMVRVMYIHVPFAWLSMMCYSVMAISALGVLVWRHPLADVSARTAAPIGATFTFLALVTGAIWGRPTWGTYWAWDARITSVFILFIMYLGLIALYRAFDDRTRAARPAAIIILVGFIIVPIIKFSVNWWNTLHQPASVLRMDGPTIHFSLLWPLLVSALGFSALFFTLHLMAMRSEILQRRVISMRKNAARKA